MKAKWIRDYDHISDKCYDRPGCPKCEAPVGKDEDEKYHCFSCGKEVEVTDPDMIRWLEERSEEKVEMEDCPEFTTTNGRTYGCGGKGCVETHYVRNHVTMEWQTAWGECKNCGARFIV